MKHLLRPASLLAAAGLLSSCGISLQSLPKIGGISGPTYKLTAYFTNVVNLPANAQAYVRALEDMMGAPVCAIGVGPRRDQTLQLRDII